MQNASAQLVWECTKSYNSFLVKRGLVSLTAEPGNPTNEHRAKFSGLANKKAVDIKGSKDKVVVTLRKVKDQNKPAKATHSVTVNAADPSRAIKVVKKLVGDSFYAPGSASVATRRVAKLAQAATRANKMSQGKLSIKYGRQAKPYPFNKASKKAEAKDDLPALSATAEAD